jgi:hypothetical protein
MLKYGEVNPLNVFGLRQLEHCPPHFQVVPFDLRAGIKDITDWIYENLSGRFWVGYYYVIESGDSGAINSMQYAVAFERHDEASYFALFLPELNQRQTF